MLLVNDSATELSRSVCQPCQVHGLVKATRRKVGTFLRLRRWADERSCQPSLRVSKSSPLVWPSLWQGLQLYQLLADRKASWNRASPRRTTEGVPGPPSGIVRATDAEPVSTTWIALLR